MNDFKKGRHAEGSKSPKVWGWTWIQVRPRTVLLAYEPLFFTWYMWLMKEGELDGRVYPVSIEDTYL